MPVLNISLTEHERKILLGAMGYLVPCGGGSYHRNLFGKLQEHLGELTEEETQEQNDYYHANALTDYMDAGDGTISGAAEAFIHDLNRQFPDRQKD